MKLVAVLLLAFLLSVAIGCASKKERFLNLPDSAHLAVPMPWFEGEIVSKDSTPTAVTTPPTETVTTPPTPTETVTTPPTPTETATTPPTPTETATTPPTPTETATTPPTPTETVTTPPTPTETVTTPPTPTETVTTPPTPTETVTTPPTPTETVTTPPTPMETVTTPPTPTETVQPETTVAFEDIFPEPEFYEYDYSVEDQANTIVEQNVELLQKTLDFSSDLSAPAVYKPAINPPNTIQTSEDFKQSIQTTGGEDLFFVPYETEVQAGRICHVLVQTRKEVVRKYRIEFDDSNFMMLGVYPQIAKYFEDTPSPLRRFWGFSGGGYSHGYLYKFDGIQNLVLPGIVYAKNRTILVDKETNTLLIDVTGATQVDEKKIDVANASEYTTIAVIEGIFTGNVTSVATAYAQDTGVPVVGDFKPVSTYVKTVVGVADSVYSRYIPRAESAWVETPANNHILPLGTTQIAIHDYWLARNLSGLMTGSSLLPHVFVEENVDIILVLTYTDIVQQIVESDVDPFFVLKTLFELSLAAWSEALEGYNGFYLEKDSATVNFVAIKIDTRLEDSVKNSSFYSQYADIIEFKSNLTSQSYNPVIDEPECAWVFPWLMQRDYNKDFGRFRVAENLFSLNEPKTGCATTTFQLVVYVEDISAPAAASYTHMSINHETFMDKIETLVEVVLEAAESEGQEEMITSEILMMLNVFIHEFGHMFGLEDVYLYPKDDHPFAPNVGPDPWVCNEDESECIFVGPSTDTIMNHSYVLTALDYKKIRTVWDIQGRLFARQKAVKYIPS